MEPSVDWQPSVSPARFSFVHSPPLHLLGLSVLGGILLRLFSTELSSSSVRSVAELAPRCYGASVSEQQQSLRPLSYPPPMLSPVTFERLCSVSDSFYLLYFVQNSRFKQIPQVLAGPYNSFFTKVFNSTRADGERTRRFTGTEVVQLSQSRMACCASVYKNGQAQHL